MFKISTDFIFIIPPIILVVSLFLYGLLLLLFALMYSWTVLFCIYKLLSCYLVHCLHCTVIQLFGYLYSRRCPSKLIVLVNIGLH